MRLRGICIIRRLEALEHSYYLFLREHSILRQGQKLRYRNQVGSIVEWILILLRPLLGDGGSQGQDAVTSSRSKEGRALFVTDSLDKNAPVFIVQTLRHKYLNNYVRNWWKRFTGKPQRHKTQDEFRAFVSLWVSSLDT